MLQIEIGRMKQEQFQKVDPDSNYYVRRAKEADEKGLPFYQIQCDVCGYIATAATGMSSNFDYCDGHSGNFIQVDGDDEPFELNCREYVLDEESRKLVSNFKAREVTGRDPEMAEWVRFTRFPEL